MSPRVDGRTARSQRTRDAILQALFELLSEGQLSPKADLIARRAGVSLRSIYQHFSDLDELFTEISRTRLRAVLESEDPVDSQLPLEDRVIAVAEKRATLYARIAPVARAAFLQERLSNQTAETLNLARQTLRDEISDVFESELAGLESSYRHTYLAALTSTTSFAVYDLIVAREKGTLEHYKQTTRTTLLALLGQARTESDQAAAT